MSEIKWNIPNPEHIMQTIEDLSGLIERNPDSPLVPIWENAIAELETLPI